MIKKLRLKNFLSYKDVSIDFNDFNVIVGANASGKTNLTKALLVLRDLIIGGHQSLEDFDGFMESVFNKNSNEEETLVIDIVLTTNLDIDLTNGEKIVAEEHHYTIEMAFGKGVVNENYWIKLKGNLKPFKILVRDEKTAKYTHEYNPDYSKCLALEIDTKSFELLRFQPMAGKALSGFLPLLQKAYCEYFLTYSLVSNQLIRPFFSRNQKMLAPNGQNLSGVLQFYKEHNPVVLDSINEVLRRNIPHFEFVDTKALGISKNYYFTVRETDGKDYVLNELSEGTDLFVGLVTAMVTSQYLELDKGQKGILIIEEPEKNLHPQLMEEIVALAKSLTDKFQVIITTHSTDLVAHLDVEDIILLDKNEAGTRLQRIKRTEQLEAYLEEFSLDQIWLNNDLGGGTVNG